MRSNTTGFKLSNKNIVPRPYEERVPIKLDKTSEFYISFTEHEVIPVQILEFAEAKSGELMVVVTDGNDEWQIFADEIGSTPTEAVQNQIAYVY